VPREVSRPTLRGDLPTTPREFDEGPVPPQVMLEKEMTLRGRDEDAVAVGEAMLTVTNRYVTTGMLKRRVI
jgi:hypothetical protein